MHSADYDICACGDYRHQHNVAGCSLCGHSPWGPCRTFRLVQIMFPQWRALTEPERVVAERAVRGGEGA